MKYKSNKKNNISNPLKKYIKKTVVQVLLCIIIVLITLIIMNKSTKIRSLIKENVYESNFNLAKINTLYKKYFGSELPFSKKLFKEQTVFNETLTYIKKEEYYDGVKLEVSSNYLIPNMETGIVVFVGEKEKYGNIVIIQTSSGIDYWYGNVNNLSVKLYDYVEKGKLIGETNDNILYMIFQKDGVYLDYNEYIN